MGKTLYIHIGTGKTGSTAIQSFLFNNKTELENINYKYCETGIKDNNHRFVCENLNHLHDGEHLIIRENIKKLTNEIKVSEFTKFEKLEKDPNLKRDGLFKNVKIDDNWVEVDIES